MLKVQSSGKMLNAAMVVDKWLFDVHCIIHLEYFLTGVYIKIFSPFFWTAFYVFFAAENVDDEAFINLNDNLVACLITKIGDRSKFLAKFTEFKDSTSLGKENLSDLTLLSSPGCSSNVSGLSTSSTFSNPCSPITVTFTDFLTNEPLGKKNFFAH